MSKKVIFFLSFILCIIFIPNVYAYDSGREVFVRHINKANGEIINGLQNANQEVINSTNAISLLNNSTSDDAEILYSEYYNYSVSSSMLITKTLVMQINGKKYNYLGYNICTMPSLDEAYNIMEQKKSSVRAGTANLDKEYDNNQSNAEYKTIASNNNDVTIIDFYYNEESVDNISPKLYSNTSVWNGNDAGLTSNVTYLPAGGMLYPYFKTPEYFVKDLSYEKVIINGKISYRINNFVVYKIDSAYLKSSESKHIGVDGQIEITGKLVGGEITSAISGINNISPIIVSNGIGNILNDETRKYNDKVNENIPGRGALDKSKGNETQPSDYNADIIIQSNILNGLRSAKGNVVYKEYNVLNGTDLGNTREFESTNDHYINIYTPVKLNDPQVTATSNASINHTTINSSTVILADDATFEIKLSCGDLDFTYYNNITPHQKANFVNYYYLIFDFDVVHNGRTYPKGTAVRLTNQADYNDGYTYFYGQVAPNETLSRDSSNHKIIVLASASNMPSNVLLQDIVDQEVAIQIDKTKDAIERKNITDSGDNTANFDNDIEYSESHLDSSYLDNVSKLYADGYYFAMKTVTVRTASKIYDFKITDCSDLAYKSAFRLTDTNTLNKNANYYSGIRRMYMYTNANKEYTTIVDRDNIRINGTTSTRTLPLGPYKHTTASYVNAPKLGYRFSFDVKTSGYYMPNSSGVGARKISIKPKYYYLSKDGSQIIKDITLYYKDQTDKYKKFNGSGYNIYFTPKDGSRYTTDTYSSNLSYMSNKNEALNIGNDEFYLTDSMMALDDTGYIQTWYGEFKLPNTTIAVKTGNSIDKALSNGYIGVKFEITCYDSKLNESISYTALNKSVNSAINTTQWDYEGYLGFSNPGQEVTQDTSLRIQLEKGIWSINSQDLYNFVKGTVILYDIDNRAADDIN